uniref:Non-specific lipid-transfer protein n=1 Tax=Cannabis sativa TaxID=3483 RepID=A0A803NV86_CANSA
MSTKRVKVVAVAVSLLMLIQVGWSQQEGSSQPQCNQVVQQLTPCVQYVTGREPKPSDACCNGAKQLAASAKTTKDRQTACSCIKQAVGGLPNVDPSRISSVPKECNIDFSLPPITRDFDCSTIKAMYW